MLPGPPPADEPELLALPPAAVNGLLSLLCLFRFGDQSFLPEQQRSPVWRYLCIELLLVRNEVKLGLLILTRNSVSPSDSIHLPYACTLWVVSSEATRWELEGLLVLAVGIGVLLNSVRREVASGYRSVSWVAGLGIRIGWELKVLIHLHCTVRDC